MVQTKQGAGENPWITYMRACAANYHAGQAQVHDAPGKPDKPTRRVKGKQAPKDSQDSAKRVTEKDTKKVENAVKERQNAKQREAKAKK